MKLQDIPGYIVRAYLICLGGAARADHHPEVNRSIQKYHLNTRLSQISTEQMKVLEQCTVRDLWRHMTLIERESIVTPCPDDEILIGD